MRDGDARVPGAAARTPALPAMRDGDASVPGAAGEDARVPGLGFLK
ncbi:MAG TPA: hypothetical protein VJ023_18435 [Pyrinomonadaceae bacterium]|nr:hypothetical protein [Pyrinomonadaceae bacterium]